MVLKFAHFADCHLGGWRQEELQSLNFQSFQKAVEIVIKEKPDFLLLAGDLFDSAYPPIEILKETFAEFKKIKDAEIPVFMIAGSHDFSASGKTFLDVLEKAGFAKSVDNFEIQQDGKIKLLPTIFKDFAIFGYSGRKSGMEIEDLKKVYFGSIHQASIFLVHSTIKDVVGNIPMEFVEKENLPVADYYAFGHIHQRFESRYENSTFVYPGPIFPNNFQELMDLKCGSFTMVEMEGSKIKTNSILLPIKEVLISQMQIDDGLTATEKIISEIDRLNLRDKIFLLKLSGILKQGKTGDIRFNEIEEFVEKKGAYAFLRNISSIQTPEMEMQIESENVENIEEKVFSEYRQKNPSDTSEFTNILPQLMNALAIEKNEDEKESIYEKRLIDDLKKLLKFEEILE